MRTADEDELYDDEDEVAPPLSAPPPPRPPEIAAAVPPDSPEFVWRGAEAPGAVLPDAELLPPIGIRFVPTSAWRRRRMGRVLLDAATELAIFVGIIGLLHGGDFGRTSLWLWGFGVGVTVLRLVIGVLNPGALSLTLTDGGFEFEHNSFRLQSGWGRVARVVQLGQDETTLALRTDTPAVAWEKGGNAKPWRRISYPWDTTVPLEPFTLGDPDRRVQRLVAGLLPGFQGVPAFVEAPHAETPGRRFVGFAIGLVPLAIGMAIYSQVLGDSPTTAVIRTLIMVGLGALTLARWNGVTGERTADFIARVVLGPAPEPKSAVLPVLGRVYASYTLFIILGLSLSSGALSTTDLTAKYGPAHQCWKDEAGLISGCQLANGTMLGESGPTPVTCYFTEPLPVGTKTFHCSR